MFLLRSVGVGLVAVMAAAGSAAGGSPSPGEPDCAAVKLDDVEFRVLPDGRTRVATNAHVYLVADRELSEELRRSAAEWITLRRAGGQRIEASFKTYPGIVDLQPAEPLAPNTRHEVALSGRSEPLGTFTTVSGRDLAPPEGRPILPHGRALHVFRDRHLPALDLIRLTADRPTDAQIPILFEISSPDLAGTGPALAVTDGSLGGGIEIGGIGACLWTVLPAPPSAWPAAVRLNVRARDLSGNVGPISEVVVDTSRRLRVYEIDDADDAKCRRAASDPAGSAAPESRGPSSSAAHERTVAPWSLRLPPRVRIRHELATVPSDAGPPRESWLEYASLPVAIEHRGTSVSDLSFEVFSVHPGEGPPVAARAPEARLRTQGGRLLLGKPTPGRPPNLIFPIAEESWRLAIRAIDPAGRASPFAFVDVDLRDEITWTNAELEAQAREILRILQTRDLARLAKQVHPRYGLRLGAEGRPTFGPFRPAELPALHRNQSRRFSLSYGEPDRRYTFEELLEKRLMDAPYAKAPSVHVDVLTSPLAGEERTQDLALAAIFPHARFVEFYFPEGANGPSRNAWSSLVVIFCPERDKGWLCGLVRGGWTP